MDRNNCLERLAFRNRTWFVKVLVACVALSFYLAGCDLNLQPVGLPPTATQPAGPPGAASSTFMATASGTSQPSQAAFIDNPADTPAPTLSPTPSPDYSVTVSITPWPNDSPTPGPSPTRTFTPTRTRVPTRTRAPTSTPTTTYTPTITLTPTPPAPVQELVRPGLMSKVLSPIQVEMYAVSGADRVITLELVGEDGRVITRQTLDYDRPWRYIYAVPLVSFEIETVSEFARLQVRSVDEYDRPIAISSVDLVLLSIGRNEIFPPVDTLEPYLVRSPRDGDTVSGGKLIVDGLARPVNSSNLILELIDDSGNPIVSQQFQVDPPGGNLSHTPFHLEIPYQVSQETNVRLIIRQEGSRIPGTVALNSWEITLAP